MQILALKNFRLVSSGLNCTQGIINCSNWDTDVTTEKNFALLKLRDILYSRSAKLIYTSYVQILVLENFSFDLNCLQGVINCDID